MHARRWISVLSATTLAATVALIGTGTLSNANATGPTPQPAGTLTLATVAGTAVGDAWTYDKGTASTTDDVTQTVGAVAGTCTLAPASGPLVNLTAANGSPGFAKHSIGVTQGTTTTSCSKVNSYKVGTVLVTESLTVALNGVSGSLTDPLFGAATASSAVLDLEVKDHSWIKAETISVGAVVGTYYLRADDDRAPTSLPPNTLYCHISDDDYHEHPSSYQDNCSWPIPGPGFDSLRLTPLAGTFSLEGGGDWADAGAHRTTFSLVSFVDGSLDCSASNSATTLGGGTNSLITGVALTRLSNGDNSVCAALPYTLSTEANTTTFHKPTPAGQETAQFAIELDRNYVVPINPVPAAQVDWEDSAPAQGLGFCTAGLVTAIGAAPGYLPTIDFSKITLNPGLDQSVAKTGTQYACVYKQSSTLNLDGSLSTSDWIYFTGDIKFRAP